MDSGASIDAAMTDTGVLADAGVPDDTAVPEDAVVVTDTGVPTGDAGMCADTPLGQTCDETAVCPPGFSCDLGRCIPQGRETCGGIAGAECPDTGHTVCLFREGHGDVGTCLSPSEAVCACSLPGTTWLCSG